MAIRPLPAEKTMNVTDTKQNFSRVINEVARGESYVVVEKSGAPVAAIISRQEMEEYKRFKEKEREGRARLFERLAELGDAFSEVSDEELEREIQKSQAEVKDDMLRERRRG